MKLPRWTVVILLCASVLMPLSLASWLWISWPARTVSDFVSALRCNRMQEATARLSGFQRTMLGGKFTMSARSPSPDQMRPELWIISEWNAEPPTISLKPRGIRELLSGKGIVRIKWDQSLPDDGRETVELEIEVVRGHICIIGETRQGADTHGSWKSSGKSTDDSWSTTSEHRRHPPLGAN